MDYLKADIVRTGHYRVLALPFGSPTKKDLDGDYFSPRTDPKADWFSERPVIFHHGVDSWVGSSKLGVQEQITRKADGWWGDVWLEKDNEYFPEVAKRIEQGTMYGSSGAMPHLVRKAKDGEILVWPHVEQTLSPRPRNHYAVVHAVKATIVHPELKDLLAKYEELVAQFEPADLEPRGDYLRNGSGDESIVAVKAALDELEAIVARFTNSGSGDPEAGRGTPG